MTQVNEVKHAKHDARRAKARQRGEPADWAQADAELMKQAVQAASFMGGALRFGYTRDGGAFAVGVYDNGDHSTDYIPPSGDINEYLRGLVEYFRPGST